MQSATTFENFLLKNHNKFNCEDETVVEILIKQELSDRDHNIGQLRSVDRSQVFTPEAIIRDTDGCRYTSVGHASDELVQIKQEKGMESATLNYEELKYAETIFNPMQRNSNPSELSGDYYYVVANEVHNFSIQDESSVQEESQIRSKGCSNEAPADNELLNKSSSYRKIYQKRKETLEETEIRHKMYAEAVMMRKNKVLFEESEANRRNDLALKALKRSQRTIEIFEASPIENTSISVFQHRFILGDIDARPLQETSLKAMKRSQLTQVEIDEKRRVNAAMEALRRSKMSPEEIERRRAKDAESKAKKRKQMTPEEMIEKRKRNAALERLRRSRMTPEEIEIRRLKDAACKARKRSLMTPAEIELKRKKNAAAKALRRSRMTSEELEIRRIKDAACKALRRRKLSGKSFEMDLSNNIMFPMANPFAF